MIIPTHIATKLLSLLEGESVAFSQAKHHVVQDLLNEGIIETQGRIKKKLVLTNRNALELYLQNRYGINDIKNYIEIDENENLTRKDLIAVSSNSKLKKVRTFKGFLINCYEPISAVINNKPITISPTEGMFQFVYDFESFCLDQNTTVVGIENPENFRFLEYQKHLFTDIKPVFVCRYPQNQSKDLLAWLKKIPNKYVHFGDFDLAGIGIYINEYKTYLGDKATFYSPRNIEELIINHGNRSIYNTQKINFNINLIKEDSLLELIKIIHKYRKGLEQEILIKKYLET